MLEDETGAGPGAVEMLLVAEHGTRLGQCPDRQAVPGGDHLVVE